MNIFKGTPGPWPYEKANNFYWILEPDGNRAICKILSRAGTHESEEANAQLIAAAPDLLKALINLVEHLVIEDEEGLIEFNEDICEAKAAISKALGK